ncbi:MAG: helix-turn-helix transcriptional regulator [Proteobacteria bacterium]|nr:helix-turn-helix transcriptional regulator [Pseudomonadota bacterium]
MDRSFETLNLADFEARAAEAAQLLKAMANENRLMVLCYLLAGGEVSVSALAEAVDLSQSALSQHLAKLREDGLVTYRRESQTLFYRVDDARALRVLAVLKDIFCPDLTPSKDLQP